MTSRGIESITYVKAGHSKSAENKIIHPLTKSPVSLLSVNNKGSYVWCKPLCNYVSNKTLEAFIVYDISLINWELSY